MPRTGRPKIEIDKKIFEQLCKMQCTEREVAGVFECSEDTVNEWCKKHYRDEHGKRMTFADVRLMYADAGKVSLRRMQWKHAERSPDMAKWLGKQYLGQSEHVETVLAVDESKDDALSASLRELAQEMDENNERNKIE